MRPQLSILSSIALVGTTALFLSSGCSSDSSGDGSTGGQSSKAGSGGSAAAGSSSTAGTAGTGVSSSGSGGSTATGGSGGNSSSGGTNSTAGTDAGGSGGSGGTVAACPTIDGDSTTKDPWKVAFIGTTCEGKVTQTDDKFVVTAVGGDIWGAADSLTFVSQPFSGTDGEVTAKITGDGNVLAAKVGVMFRASEDPAAAMAYTYGTLGDGAQFLPRAASSMATPVFSVGFSTPGLSSPVYVKTVKHGNKLTGFASHDGQQWLQLSTQTVDFGADAILAGLAVGPNNAGAAAEVTFEEVEVATQSDIPVIDIPTDLAPDAAVTAYAGALPAGYKGVKLGAANAADKFAADGDKVSITSVGADIWNAADSAGFVYKEEAVSGDFDFDAKVDEFETFFEWAKAGITVRASLMPDAANTNLVFAAAGVDAMTGAVNAHGVCQQQRLVANTKMTSKCVSFMSGSGYLRISRRGQILTGYLSRNGTDWFEFQQDTFAAADLPAAVYVGVIAANHQDSKAAVKAGTAAFSAIKLTSK